MIGSALRGFGLGVILGRTVVEVNYRVRKSAYKHANQTMKNIREADANGFFDEDTTKGETTK